MSIPSLISRYLEVNLLLLVGFSIGSCAQFWVSRRGRLIQPSQLLKLTYFLLTLVIALPFFTGLFPQHSFLTHPIQIWSGPTFRTEGLSLSQNSELISVSTHSTHLGAWAGLGTAQEVLLVLLLAGAAITLGRTLLGTLRLRNMIRSSLPIRKIGHVNVVVSENTSIPFSYWLPLKAWIVLPYDYLLDSSKRRLALIHELQHHRQKDTQWVHLLQLLKVFFFWNPIVHLWEKKLSILQEFACDEAVVGRKSVSPRAYGRCLLEAAEHCLGSHCLPVGTTGMAVSTSGKTLKRRIDMIFNYPSKRINRSVRLVTGTLAFAILGTVAFASQGLIRDRRVTLIEAQKLARTASQDSEFPVVVNSAVVEQLNRFIGTPDGRAFIKESMARMQSYRSMIVTKLKTSRFSLPLELLAVPLVESGYQNVKREIGAGLWMFIVSTAQYYKLRVDEQVDERLNPELETDAALEYLSHNYFRFGDWHLAVLAYNMGETQVQNGIDTIGSKDAWKLIAAGYGNDKDYLPSVMAAVLIMKNPSLLD